MSASFFEDLRNAKLATSYDTVTGIHTLKITTGSDGSASFIRFAENTKLASDEVAGVHTLKTVSV